MRTESKIQVCYSLHIMTCDASLPLVGRPGVVPPFNVAYANDPLPSSSSASHPCRLTRPYRRNMLRVSSLVTQRPRTRPNLRPCLTPTIVLTPHRIIPLTRNPTPPPTAPPPNIPMGNLQNSTSPQGMTQLIVQRARIQRSSRNALTLQLGVVEILSDLKADFLDDVDFNLGGPGDTPWVAVLRGVEGARGAGAAVGTVNCVIVHRVLVLGLIIVRDVVLCRVSAITLS